MPVSHEWVKISSGSTSGLQDRKPHTVLVGENNWAGWARKNRPSETL